mmetsp:Transcript_73670/g.146489  ORF Transcript_73670/g.146489 Transcript_73670/m.146489 type:complete len:529 (-) Transcript_73670:745-2331(-)|eukprot:CAMPEP_0174716584 /NCGR_PEP_ID=MMETSP1094-20130205/24331_1 /TAXON_ID=156173 /ORGANISM="Chrysochromulina brevifilum, Strain UTEX LB 985" /LENGTH=528 /DNA_ID=CAMNT_0015916353 /DNA_START=179 /DNA_END=1765 /DNA_ORIENTATION=-
MDLPTNESFEHLRSSTWTLPPGPATPPPVSLTPSEINAGEPYRPLPSEVHAGARTSPAPTVNGHQQHSHADNVSDTGSEGSGSQEERLAALATAQASREAAQREFARLATIMEEFLDEDEVSSTLEGMRSNPAEYLSSRRPAFRKAAAAIEEERKAAARMAEIEQQIRDHSMSPQDMMVEVRSLIRKQNAGFEVMRSENERLVARVAELEAVVAAIVSLPQLCQRPSDFDFASSEVVHAANQSGQTTLLHLAAQKKLYNVAEYVMRVGHSPREQRAVVLLNSPEEKRSYEHPKASEESSMIGEQGWNSYRRVGNAAETSWLQLDAGRKVHMMGWWMKLTVSEGDHSCYLDLLLSDDGKTWTATPHRLYFHNQKRLHGNSLAHARYFRFKPNKTADKPFQLGLLVIDDHGDYLVPPRYVRDLTPLHIAAKGGDVQMINMLLDHGADPELLADCWQRNNDSSHPNRLNIEGGTTALTLAAAGASLHAVQALVDRGAKVHEHRFKVPKGKEGDLVAGYLQTNGSKPIDRVD